MFNQCKREEYRIKGNVRTAEIKKPGDIVQRSNKVRIGLTLLQRFSQLRQLFCTAHSGLWRRMFVQRLNRERGTPLPHQPQHVDIGTQLRTPLFQPVFQCAGRRQGQH